MKAAVYRIAKWTETFETADSRRHKSLAWVSLPVVSSNGYNDLIETFGDEAPMIYGAWCAMLRVAAQAPERGTLANSKGVGYSLGRIASETRFPIACFERLFAWASSETVGWLEVVPSPADNQSTNDCQPAVNRATDLTDLTQQDLTDRPTEPPVRPPVEIDSGFGDRIVLGTSRWVESKPTRERIARVVSRDQNIVAAKLRPDDYELAIKAAAVAHFVLDMDWLDGVLKSISSRKEPLDNAWAFFRSGLIKAATRAGKDYHAAESRIVIPARHTASTGEQSCTAVSG